MSEEKRGKVVEKLREDYSDFGPTFANAKLAEREGINVSKETVRQIMIEVGFHQPKTGKKDRIHPLHGNQLRITPGEPVVKSLMENLSVSPIRTFLLCCTIGHFNFALTKN